MVYKYQPISEALWYSSITHVHVGTVNSTNNAFGNKYCNCVNIFVGSYP